MQCILESSTIVLHKILTQHIANESTQYQIITIRQHITSSHPTYLILFTLYFRRTKIYI